MGRSVVVVVLVLAAVLVAADRVAAAVAGWRAGEALQSALQTPSRPSVSVSGFPFVTQVLGGVYRQVRLSATDVAVASVPVASLTATLRQVRLQGSSTVTAESADGTALLQWSDLAEAARLPGLVLSAGPAPDQVRVSRPLTVLGVTVALSGVATVTVVDGGVRVTATSVDVGGTSTGSLLPEQLRSMLTFTVAVSGLPGGMRLAAVTSTEPGLRLAFTGTDVTFTTPPA